MLSTGTDYSKEAEIVGRLQEFNVKGAVLFPVVTNPAEMAHYSQMILSCPYPVVLIELALPGMGRPLVVGDGMHAGYTMTRCLLDQGLRRIGFLAHYAWAPYIRDRYLGYRQAMEEAGLSIDERTVHLDPAMTPDFEDPTREPQQIAATYLDQNQDLEGVVCAMDFLALGLIEAARAKGSAVPRDLKVTGIDDIGVAASAAVPLTTYHMPYEIMGSRAFELLDEQMNGRRASRLEVQVRGELVRRVSA
jgi:DNA-binding LacI/PurR family transcriptional regulator